MAYKGYSKYKFTENMAVLVRNKMSDLENMYCREDYEQAIRDVKKAPKDARLFKIHALKEMCKGSNNLTVDILLSDESVLSSIPTRRELLDRLVDIIHEIYLEFPSPAAYMKRITYNLAPEYRDDTVRTAILKKFIKGAGFDCREYKITAIAAWAFERMTASEQKDYDLAADAVKIDMLLEKIDDSIFTEEHLQATLNATEILRLLVKRMDSCASELDLRDKDDKKVVFPGVKLDEETKRLLYRYCQTMNIEVDSHSDILSLLKAVLKISTDSQSDNPEFNQLVKALETNITDQMRGIIYKDKHGKNARAIGLYRDNKRDRANSLIKPWELLRVCNELASGSFKMNGATRVNLYHFAIMFHMTVALKDTDGFDPVTNIVKNLFEDFYNDNLVRYLEKEFDDARYSSRFEKEPTGEGINFKNYVESIYLYYLYRTDLRLTPGERIDKSVQLINACVKEATSRKTSGTLLTEAYSDYTDLYKELYVSQMVDMDEAQLLDFVVSHYLILPMEKGDNGAGILMSSEERTAFDAVQKMMSELDKEYSVSQNASQLIAKANHGKAVNMSKFFEETIFESHFLFTWKLAGLLCERFQEDTDFVRMIKNLDARLVDEFNWIGSMKKELLVNLLHLLYKNSSKECPLMIDTVTETLKKKDFAINGAMVLDGIDILGKMGFDVHRKTDNKTGRSLLWLDNRSYDDDSLNETIKRVSKIYLVDESSVIKIIDKILDEKMKLNKRISRTTLLVIYTTYYVSLFDETNGIDSFHDLYEDFTTRINPVLEECRFQAWSEKNILDMYVLISLYYYLIENGQ